MRLFCSYSHIDRKYRDNLAVHLASLRRQMLLDELWHDRLIQPGHDWQKEIEHQIEIADIVVLLVSPHFIASSYCWGIELKRALEREREGNTIIVPIIIRDCDWEHTEFGRLQALPQNGKPINSTGWKNQDEAWTDVAKQIRTLIMTQKRVNAADVHNSVLIETKQGKFPTSSHYDEIKGALFKLHRNEEGGQNESSLELTGEECFLSVQRHMEKLRVRVVSGLDELVLKWNASTRIAPIFGLRFRGVLGLPNCDFTGDHNLLLLGPVAPARAVEIGDAMSQAWVTIGSFNIIAKARSEKGSKEIIGWAKANNIRYEVWQIRDGYIIDASYGYTSIQPSTWHEELAGLTQLEFSHDIKDAVNDYCVLMATALSQSSQSAPSLHVLLERTNTAVCTILEMAHSESSVQTQRIIEQVNHGLAELTAQALVNVSPVLEGRGSYRIHSLLGIGTANLALGNLYIFAEQAVGAARIPQRLEKLCSTIQNFPRLDTLSYKDDFWHQDHLGYTILDEQDNIEPLIPPITYFSDYEGFRSSILKLSAPSRIISSCNSLQWNPVILSHEISHRIIQAVLSLFIPCENQDLSFSIELLQTKRNPKTLFDEIRRYLILAIIMIEKTSHNRPIAISLDNDYLSHILRKWFYEIEEIMTHTFDYLYFYGQDAELYIKTMWQSWIGLPDISDKIYGLVIRSVSSIELIHTNLGSFTGEIAVKQVRQILNDLHQSGFNNPYIEQAISYLNEKQPLMEHITARKPLSVFVRSFLYSTKIAASLGREPIPKKNSVTSNNFELIPIYNPFKFLWMLTGDVDACPSTSAWILNMLAYNSELIT